MLVGRKRGKISKSKTNNANCRNEHYCNYRQTWSIGLAHCQVSFITAFLLSHNFTRRLNILFPRRPDLEEKDTPRLVSIFHCLPLLALTFTLVLIEHSPNSLGFRYFPLTRLCIQRRKREKVKVFEVWKVYPYTYSTFPVRSSNHTAAAFMS